MNGMGVAVAIVVGLMGAGGLASIIVKQMEIRAKRSDGSRENALVDQLQEENRDLRARCDRLEANQRILTAYVFELYAHIADGKPPPPPPMPNLT